MHRCKTSVNMSETWRTKAKHTVGKLEILMFRRKRANCAVRGMDRGHPFRQRAVPAQPPRLDSSAKSCALRESGQDVWVNPGWHMDGGKQSEIRHLGPFSFGIGLRIFPV
jgi:hypothetical protein